MIRRRDFLAMLGSSAVWQAFHVAVGRARRKIDVTQMSLRRPVGWATRGVVVPDLSDSQAPEAPR